MKTSKPTPPERGQALRMHELLDAALQVFATQGYRHARVDDVAEAAGVTKGAIYYYFDTKEALLLGVINHFQAAAFGRAEDALRDPALSAATRIRMVIRTGAHLRPDAPVHVAAACRRRAGARHRR
jgi:AcrR family transcriptional regulator